MSQFAVHGFARAGFEAVREAFADNFSRRHELGGACCIYLHGEKVVDLWGGIRNNATGEAWDEGTMVLVHSATKGLAAMTLAVAHSHGWLDYEERVCRYWPEFAQEGKGTVTVRQLLAHQAGLFAFGEPVDRSVVADLDRLAIVLARQKPAWEPGRRQAYHAITLGFFEGELLRRVDPQHRSLGQFFQEEIASPLGLDFYIRLPASIPTSRLAVLEHANPLTAMARLPFRLMLAALNPQSVASSNDVLVDVSRQHRADGRLLDRHHQVASPVEGHQPRPRDRGGRELGVAVALQRVVPGVDDQRRHANGRDPVVGHRRRVVEHRARRSLRHRVHVVDQAIDQARCAGVRPATTASGAPMSPIKRRLNALSRPSTARRAGRSASAPRLAGSPAAGLDPWTTPRRRTRGSTKTRAPDAAARTGGRRAAVRDGDDRDGLDAQVVEQERVGVGLVVEGGALAKRRTQIAEARRRDPAVPIAEQRLREQLALIEAAAAAVDHQHGRAGSAF